MLKTPAIHERKITPEVSNKMHHLKFVLAILVVLIHTMNYTNFGGSQKDWLYYIETFVSDNVCRVAVPMFFALSGVLFFRSVNRIKDVFDNQKKRVMTVLIPFLLWNALYTSVFLIVFKIPGLSSIINKSDPLTIVNVLKGIFLYEYSYQNWYLFNLIILFCVTPFIFLLLKKRAIATIVLIMLAVVNLLGLSYGYFKVSEYFYFYLGAFMVTWCPKTIFKTGYKRWAITTALVVFLLLNLFRLFSTNAVIDRAILILTLPCVWIFFDVFSKKKAFNFEKESFFVYCSHILILETIEKLIGMLGRSRILGLFDYIVAPILCVLIIYVIYKVLSKLIPWVYDFLTKGKFIVPPKDLERK